MRIDFGPGMAALQRGDLNGAVTGFMQTLEQDPTNIPVHMMLASTLVRGRSWLAALRVYYDIIRIDPTGTHPLNNVQQLDDGIAEAIVGWSKDYAASGYTPPKPAELGDAIGYYLANFRLHANGIASIEAAIAHRAPIMYDFTPAAQ